MVDLHKIVICVIIAIYCYFFINLVKEALALLICSLILKN